MASSRLFNYCIYSIILSLALAVSASEGKKHHHQQEAELEPVDIQEVDNIQNAIEARGIPAEVLQQAALAEQERLARGDGGQVDVVDQGQNDALNPELIPVAETRKVRGNGADLSAEINPTADADSAAGVNAGDNNVEGNVPDIIKNVEQEDVLIPADADKREIPCVADGETCEENAGCCSKFCSWTRGFICYTMVG